MTVDAALTAGFALCLLTGRRRALWWILAAAPLVRETGLLLIAATVLPALWKRQFRAAAVLASAAVPFLLWFVWLNSQLPPPAPDPHAAGVPHWLLPQIRIGILERLFTLRPYLNLTPASRLAARILDALAILATIATGLLALPRIRFGAGGALRMALILFASLLLALTDKYFWNTPYGYARMLGPLFVLLLATPAPRPAWAGLTAAVAACLLIDLRIAAEMLFQLRGIIAWLSPL